MGRKLKYLFIFLGVLLILNLVYGQQAINGSRYILGYWDASQARWTKPFMVSASQPATCAVGEVMFDSDATAGQNLYLCTATDTWTQVTGGGGSGDMTKAVYDTDDDGTVDLAAVAAALAADPSACSAGEFVTDIAADGSLTCDTPPAGTGTPAGAAGNVQYNADGTSLGAEAAFTYDSSTNILTSGKYKITDNCTLGGLTTIAAGTICNNGTYGVLVSDGTAWYTATFSQNNVGEIWYSGSNFEPFSSIGFSYASSILTVPTVKPTTSIRGTASNVINLDPDSDGTMEVNFDASGNFSGQAATAVALSADGTNCSAGQAPLGVDASGNVQSCFTPTATQVDIDGDGTLEISLASTAMSIDPDENGTAELTIDASGNSFRWDINNDGTTEFQYDADGTAPYFCMDPDDNGNCDFKFVDIGSDATPRVGISFHDAANPTILHDENAKTIHFDYDEDGTYDLTLDGSAVQITLDPNSDGTNDMLLNQTFLQTDQVRYSTESAARMTAANGRMHMCGGNQFAPNAAAGACLTLGGSSGTYEDLIQFDTDGDATIDWAFDATTLGDCDNSTTSKVLWDTTSKKFSCGTDQTSGASTQVDIDGDGTREISLTAGDHFNLDPDEDGTIELTLSSTELTNTVSGSAFTVSAYDSIAFDPDRDEDNTGTITLHGRTDGHPLIWDGNLADCDGDGSTLGYDQSTGFLTCGDDDTGGGSQNIWSTIDVDGTGDVAPDSTADTLTITAGTGITISGTAASDTITITNSSPASGISQVDIDGDGTREISLASSILKVDSDEDATASLELQDETSSTVRGTIIGRYDANYYTGIQFVNDGDGYRAIVPYADGPADVGTLTTPLNDIVANGVLKFSSGGVTNGSVSVSQWIGYDAALSFIADTENDGTGEGINFDPDGDSTNEFVFDSTMPDCDGDGSTVSYDITTGKFGCGDDDSGGTQVDIDGDGTREISLTSEILSIDPEEDGTINAEILGDGSGNFILRHGVADIGILFYWDGEGFDIRPSGSPPNIGSPSTPFGATYVDSIRATGITAGTSGNDCSYNTSGTTCVGTAQGSIRTEDTSLVFTADSDDDGTGEGINLDPDGDGTNEFVFDGSLGDCDGDGSSVSYDVTTGKFGCGDDDSGGGSQNLWLTVDTSSGTDVTADNTADTLVLSGGTGITVTGDGTNTVTIASTVTDTDDQPLWLTINTSSGTDVTADDSADTLNLTGGTGITITGDGTATVTIASTITDTGDELTINGTAVTTPNLLNNSDITFSLATSDITATTLPDSHQHDISYPAGRAIYNFADRDNYDSDNDGTNDTITWTSFMAASTDSDYYRVFDPGDAANESAGVWSSKYQVWIGIRNGANHIKVFPDDFASAAASTIVDQTFAAVDLDGTGATCGSGSNVDSEAATLVSPDSDYLYIGTEAIDSCMGIIEYSIPSIMTATGSVSSSKAWRLDNVATCTVGNSGFEGVAFIPDPTYCPAEYTTLPCGYFLVQCQATGTTYRVQLDTSSGNPTSSVIDSYAAPCGLSASAGTDLAYDWRTGQAWMSVGSDIGVFDPKDGTCLQKITSLPTTDTEGLAFGPNGQIMLGDDGSGYWRFYKGPPATPFNSYQEANTVLKRRADCTATTDPKVDGELCWDINSDTLNAYTGAANTIVGGNIGNDYVLVGDGTGQAALQLPDCDGDGSTLAYDQATNAFTCGDDDGVGDMTKAVYDVNTDSTVDSAAALASDPSDCSANQFAQSIATSGNLTCAAIADADVPNTITIDRSASSGKLDSDNDGTGEVTHSSSTISFDPDDDGTAESTIDGTGNFSGTAAVATMANEIEDGTGVTADSAGEIKLDTTANQLVYYGTAARVYDPRQTLSAVLMAPTDADTPIIFKAPYGMTITDIDCIVGAATSAVIDVQECTNAGASCATVDATITCDTDGAADDGTLSNGGIDAGDWIKLDIGTVTGTVGYVSVTIIYTITQE